MILYSLTRWPIESLRSDEPAIFAGMTLSQNISVGLLLLGLVFWAKLPTRPAGRHADNAGLSMPIGVQPGPEPGSLAGLAAGIVHSRP